ncbi:hypothetical protein L7F22_040541 [Adiantum nelumboides]|nr:hypothetical protein [Adiantum nelumboides]
MADIHGRGAHTLPYSTTTFKANMHTDELAAAPLQLSPHNTARPFDNLRGAAAGNNLINAEAWSFGDLSETLDVAPAPILAVHSMDRPHHLFWSFLENSGRNNVTKLSEQQSTESTNKYDSHMPNTAASNMMKSNMLMRSTLSSEFNMANFCKNFVIEEEENVQYGEGESGMRKKKRLTGEQLRALEGSFKNDRKLEADRKQELAQRLNLEPRQIAVWFQNRRARSKAKHLEHDFALLKAQYDSALAETLKLRAEVTRLTAELAAATPKETEGQAGLNIRLSIKPACEQEILSEGAQEQDQPSRTHVLQAAACSNGKKETNLASPPSMCCSTDSHTAAQAHGNDVDHNGSHAASATAGMTTHHDGHGVLSTPSSNISSACGGQLAAVPHHIDEPFPNSSGMPSNSTTHNARHPLICSNISSSPPNYHSQHSPPPNYATNYTKLLPPKDLPLYEVSTTIKPLHHLPCNTLPFPHQTSSSRHTPIHPQYGSSFASQLPLPQPLYDNIVQPLPSNYNNMLNDRSSNYLLNSSNTLSISRNPNHRFTPFLNLNHNNIDVAPVPSPFEIMASSHVPFSNYDDFFASQRNHANVGCTW